MTRHSDLIDVVTKMLREGQGTNGLGLKSIAKQLCVTEEVATMLINESISRTQKELKDLSDKAITKINSIESELFKTIEEWNDSGKRDFKLQDKVNFLAMQYAYA